MLNHPIISKKPLTLIHNFLGFGAWGGVCEIAYLGTR